MNVQENEDAKKIVRVRAASGRKGYTRKVEAGKGINRGTSFGGELKPCY